MTPATCHGKRIAIVLMTAGVALLLGLGICYWDTVRDHVEAWHIQLTTDTETIDPVAASNPTGEVFFGPAYRLWRLSRYSKRSVIFASSDSDFLSRPVFDRLTADAELLQLRGDGFRILEQRFPQRAYIVLRDR